MKGIIRLVFGVIIMSLIFMTVALSAETPQGISGNRIAVLDIGTSDNFDKQLSNSVSGAMRSEIAKIGKYKVLEQDRMHTALGGRECQIVPYSSDCFTGQGQLLKVGRIITGTVIFFNKLYYLSFQIVNANTGKVENIAESECAEDGIIDAAKRIATKLTNNKFYFLQPNPKPDWRSSKEITDYALGTLESPYRDTWQQPQKVVDHLPINPGDAIAEIGSGSGYFTGFLSKKTGEQGTVYSVDIDKDMLEHLGERVKKEGLRNVKMILANPAEPTPLSKDSIDVAFLCEVYFVISNMPDKVEFMKQLTGILKKEGKLVIVDFHKPPKIPYVPVTAIDFGSLDINPEKPEYWDTIAKMLTISHFKNVTGNAGIAYRFRVSREQVIEEVSNAGYKLDKAYDFLPYQYFLVFSKK